MTYHQVCLYPSDGTRTRNPLPPPSSSTLVHPPPAPLVLHPTPPPPPPLPAVPADPTLVVEPPHPPTLTTFHLSAHEHHPLPPLGLESQAPLLLFRSSLYQPPPRTHATAPPTLHPTDAALVAAATDKGPGAKRMGETAWLVRTKYLTGSGVSGGAKPSGATMTPTSTNKTTTPTPASMNPAPMTIETLREHVEHTFATTRSAFMSDHSDLKHPTRPHLKVTISHFFFFFFSLVGEPHHGLDARLIYV